MTFRTGRRIVGAIRDSWAALLPLALILARITASDPLIGAGAAEAVRSPQSVKEASAATTLIGVVLPVDVRVGDVGSGSVVIDPQTYDDVPALKVIPLRVPHRPNASAQATLEGLIIELGGYAEPATEPLTFTVREGATSLPVVVRRADSPTPIAAATIPIPLSAGGGTAARPSEGPPPAEFTTPPVCVAGTVQKIEGPLSGNSHETSIRVAGQQATILAQTPRAVYWRLPDQIPTGPHQLTLQQDRTSVSFDVCVLKLAMHADRSTLAKGQSTRFTATASGPELMPADTWNHAGVPSDLVNMVKLGQIAPGFRAPKPGDRGTILFRIDNVSRGTVSIRPSDGETVVKALDRQNFLAGPYTFSGTIQAKVGGPFKIDSLVVAFLRPIPGRRTTTGAPIGPGPTALDLVTGSVVHVEGTPGGGSGLWIVPVKVNTADGSRIVRVFFDGERAPALKFCDWIRITKAHADPGGAPHVDGFEKVEDPSKTNPPPAEPPAAPKDEKPPEVVRPPAGGAPVQEGCKEGDVRPGSESPHEIKEFEFVDENSQLTIQLYTDIDGALGAAKNMAQFWKTGAVVFKTLGKAVPGGGIVGVLTKYLDEGGAILDAVALSGLANRAREVTIQVDVVTTVASVEWWTVEVCRGGTWVREKRCKVLSSRQGAYKKADTIRFVDQDRWGTIANDSKPQMLDPAKVEAWAKAFVKQQMELLGKIGADYAEFAKDCK
jgi:hypothetical protein